MGVGAVVVDEGRVLLIRRGKEPLRGRWLVPGGTVEWGETLEEALVREVQEETGLLVRPREMVAVLDRIHREGEAVLHHFVIVDYLCERVAGTLRAGSDADEAALVPVAELGAYDLPDKAAEVVEEGLRRCGIVARISSTTLHPET
ncbi:MAG TPA: NUDIX hydrolase [Vicinamibacteria bacterium]|nr:NUDIX hydrolase [Vicinamibacteria bacterium]